MIFLFVANTYNCSGITKNDLLLRAFDKVLYAALNWYCVAFGCLLKSGLNYESVTMTEIQSIKMCQYESRSLVWDELVLSDR